MTKMFDSYRLKSQDPVMNYIFEKSIRLQPVHMRLFEVSIKHAQGMMTGTPEIIQLNMNLIKTMGAKKVIDIGSFTGFSAMGAALAMPNDGKVIACEVNNEFTNIGKPYWEEAGVLHKIELKLQPALQTLDELIANGESGTFDFAFIDANKDHYDGYYEKCLKLIRKGGIISIDNTLWMGSVAIPEIGDSRTKYLKNLNDKIFKDDRVDISLLSIGDGLTLCFVR